MTIHTGQAFVSMLWRGHTISVATEYDLSEDLRPGAATLRVTAPDGSLVMRFTPAAAAAEAPRRLPAVPAPLFDRPGAAKQTNGSGSPAPDRAAPKPERSGFNPRGELVTRLRFRRRPNTSSDEEYLRACRAVHAEHPWIAEAVLAATETTDLISEDLVDTLITDPAGTRGIADTTMRTHAQRVLNLLRHDRRLLAFKRGGRYFFGRPPEYRDDVIVPAPPERTPRRAPAGKGRS